MTDVSLSATTRTNLLDLQRSADLRLRTTDRISTGREVNRVTDDPVRFFQAFAVSKRVTDLFDLKKGTGQAISAIESALAGTDAIEDLTDQLRGLAISARNATDEQRRDIAAQFDVLRNQIDALAADISYGGVSLLDNPAGSITQLTGDINQGSITVSGQSSDISALGIGSAISSYNDFATDADIDVALAGIDGAVTTLRNQAAGFGYNVAALTIAEDFNQSLTQTLQAGNDILINADVDQEAANLLSSRIRDQLRQEGLRVAQQSESAVFQLLSGVSG